MSMKLKSYVRSECFIHDLAATTRDDALREMVRVMAEKGIIKDQATTLERLLERERIQSTAVGSGIAIPHCFTDEIADLVIVVARAPGGIAFDSFDGRPTHVVFLLVGNRQEHGLHLKALARIARLLKGDELRRRLRALRDPAAIYQLLLEEDNKVGA